ncbi:uncharacterized protein M6G45_012485 [Spheniscus humboldti]
MTVLTARMEKHRPRLTGPRLPLQALEFLLWSSGMGCLGNNVVSILQAGASFLFPEDLAEKRLLRRARLSPKRLPAMTVKSEQGQKAEGSEPRARQLPAIPGSSLEEKEEKEKLIPLVGPRTVDFVARTIERREKKKHSKTKEKLPERIQKYLVEKEKKRTELAEEEKSKRQTPPATKGKAKREKETPEAKAKRQGETQRSRESSSSEQSSVSSPTSTETGESSPDLLEMMMEEWEEAREEPATVHEDDAVPAKR